MLTKRLLFGWNVDTICRYITIIYKLHHLKYIIFLDIVTLEWLSESGFLNLESWEYNKFLNWFLVNDRQYVPVGQYKIDQRAKWLIRFRWLRLNLIMSARKLFYNTMTNQVYRFILLCRLIRISYESNSVTWSAGLIFTNFIIIINFWKPNKAFILYSIGCTHRYIYK